MENNYPLDQSNQSKLNVSPKSLIMLLGAVLLFSSLIFYGFWNISSNQNNNHEQDSEAKNNNQKLESPHTLVYGNWTSSKAEIKAFNMTTQQERLIASLPIEVKKVTVLSSDEIMFINHTDTYDQGETIDIYSFSTKTSRTIIQASSGVKIDDYVLSPNKRYLATWEVANSSENSTLLGGKSQVYTIDLQNPTIKNLIFDEAPTSQNPVHYPSGITDNGQLFADRFLPNSTAGWAHGMSSSSLSGNPKSTLSNMQQGSYGTKPVISPDGKYLAFAGYDGTYGDGTNITEGFRQALVTPNTVDILDTDTLERTTLPGLPDDAYFPFVSWNSNHEIVFYAVGNSQEESGLYNYDLLTNSYDIVDKGDYKFFETSLSDGKLLVGDKNENSAVLGNLGRTYQSPFTNFYIFDPNTSNSYKLPTNSNFAQFIDVLPNDYIPDNIGDEISSNTQNSDKSLQMGYFPIKESLEENRQDQQQNPIEEDDEVEPTPTSTPTPTIPQGRERQPVTFVTSPPTTPKPTSSEPQEEKIYCNSIAASICIKKHPVKNHEYGVCVQDTIPQLRESGQCNSSPLYLYGPEGLNVKATIHTPIFDSNAKHNRNTYDITLGKNGEMFVSGSVYQGISYNYTPALRRIKQPNYGAIVKRSEVKKVLKAYAQKLGLNTKETNDLLIDGEKAARDEFVMVSFFDHKTSHAILPITFSPKPDVYRNIVFYFKNFKTKPQFSLNTPTFEKITRKGITAIEISIIIE